MKVALQEARISLREGNKGFGAVLSKAGSVIAQSHDTAEKENDPTAHAEMNLVRAASRILGRDLTGCVVVSTHEPCPMCSGALIWARVSEIAYGVSIEQSRRKGMTMIGTSCEEIVRAAPWKVTVTSGVLEGECSRLYDREVRSLIKVFRAARASGWRNASRALLENRVEWFDKNEDVIRGRLRGTDVEKAYQLLLMKLEIAGEDAPVVEKSNEKLVFHSTNRCPALDACEILGLDTRDICRRHSERATDGLIKKINPALTFSRNYERLRPLASYCEEIIAMNAQSSLAREGVTRDVGEKRIRSISGSGHIR